MIARALLATALGALAVPALAQDGAPAPATATPEVVLEQAYKREYAFLEAQKRELTAREAETRRRFEADRARLQTEIATLESRALAAKSEAESLADALARAEERAEVAAGSRELLGVTVEQARATLGSFGVRALDEESFGQASVPEQLRTVFATAADTLARLNTVRTEPGAFHLADGTEVQGTLVRFGNVAVFGVSPQGSGALAPAGGGAFRLWRAPAADSAEALARGQTPPVLKAFLFENVNTAVAEPEAKTLWGEVRKGGVIGYLILLLGALALALVALRALFLKNAGAAIAPIIATVERPLREGRIDDAIAGAKRFKGSAARVVTAALRNLDRDREHLEDIVSESILHESGHLNRFGSFITVIAAVAPLLGLLGTVTGMIQTFDVITEFGTSDPKLLSGGIAVALVTTELGLAVAIPTLLLGNLLGGWAERIKDDMEKAALKVINLYQDVKLASLKQAA
ncbi:MotA/TolQ/ExbB proton channel family protein [Rehaibacterium terrae]|uniref:Biopolymer transport protein ExbB n=1 Tax=Rehaibacterium terrae TaxID=1341696 RepID=A0A7W7Y144_9GAMM|nr:MotA/TolQ/ExbB proton channel family protein [Rehaibacterium terrae]MBB5016181.1 biopolymer transport protein ExbB [Rehaibacterium terrae]